MAYKAPQQWPAERRCALRLWMLLPGGGQADAATTRDHIRHAIGPVWEANHVWLIFVLTVCWTCYPVSFGSIVSTRLGLAA